MPLYIIMEDKSSTSIKISAITGIIIAVISMGLMTTPLLALDVNGTETANITVSISAITMVNIDPSVLSWSGLNPGDIGTNDTEATGYFAIQIENIGSKNITHIWFNATYPSSRPFGTANVTKYNAGNFVVLAKDNSSGGATPSFCNGLDKYNAYKYPNRVEYPEMRTLVYLKDDAGNMPPESRDYGRFRFADEEYFWMVINDTDCASKSFYVGKEPHTATQSGSVDFSVAGNRVTVTLSATPTNGWCYGNITGHDELTDYGVLVENGTSGANRKVMLTWWNKDAVDGAAGHYLFEGSNLVPGNSTSPCVKVYIPYGVHQGTVETGILTVVVNSV